MKTTYKGLAALGAIAAGAATANILISRKVPAIYNPLGGHDRTYRWRLGDIFYAMDGEGEPVLFLHGISAGGSSFEWRRNFYALAENYTVYAPDLLGFGLSDKPAIPYMPEIYVQLIADFILDVIGRPTNIAASSHSGAYAILAAEKYRLIISRLMLSCPTGIGFADSKTSMNFGLSTAFSVPILGKSAYFAMTSRSGIEQYLKTMIFANPSEVTEDVIDRYYNAAHQTGADHVAKSFVAGHLNVGVRKEFSSLVQPIGVAWGRNTKIAPADTAHLFAEANPDARVEIIEDTGQLPHYERPDVWNTLARDTFASPPEGATVPPHSHEASEEA